MQCAVPLPLLGNAPLPALSPCAVTSTPSAPSPWPALLAGPSRSVAHSPLAAPPAATAAVSAARTADHASRPLSALTARHCLRESFPPVPPSHALPSAASFSPHVPVLAHAHRAPPSPLPACLSAQHLSSPRAQPASSAAPPYSPRHVQAAAVGSSEGNGQRHAGAWERGRWPRGEGQTAQGGGRWMNGQLVGVGLGFAHMAKGQMRSRHVVTAQGAAAGDSEQEVQRRREQGHAPLDRAQEWQGGAEREGKARGMDEASAAAAAAAPSSPVEAQQQPPRALAAWQEGSAAAESESEGVSAGGGEEGTVGGGGAAARVHADVAAKMRHAARRARLARGGSHAHARDRGSGGSVLRRLKITPLHWQRHPARLRVSAMPCCAALYWALVHQQLCWLASGRAVRTCLVICAA
ncbi:hypothetical protein CLOM_g7804 [Closterium sp. NIES-68]|nr:hypothetical protein CLOM_g7804 [Closterium sp. NIES-68]GJP82436.1 hypothetical protein CLOP_g12696 [Closterium sp. NIES-67]